MSTSLRCSRRLLAAMVLAAVAAGGAWAQTSSTVSTPPAALVTYPIGDPLVFVGSGGLVALSYFLEAHKPKPDLSSLNPANIPPFDRLYTTHRSRPLSLVSDGTLAATALLPATMIPWMSKDEIISGGIVYAETVLLSYGVKSVVKGLVVRYRPYAYGAGSNSALAADPEIEDSFPSGHVTVAFAAAVATGIINDLYNTSAAQRAAVWSASLGLATATAVLRVWSGNHFVSDVVGAAAIGSLIGFIVPFLHSPKSMSAVGLTLSVTPKPVPSSGIPILQWDVRLP